MDAQQKIYYALGQLAYVIAQADGSIQKEEKTKLHQITVDACNHMDVDFDYSEIIFLVLDKDHQDPKTVYESAIKNLKSVKHFFDNDFKADFIATLEKIADAYPPYSIDEENLIDKIRKEIRAL